MGIILSLSGLCLRTKTQGKKRILFESLEDRQQKFKTTDRGLISQTHRHFLEVCLQKVSSEKGDHYFTRKTQNTSQPVHLASKPTFFGVLEPRPDWLIQTKKNGVLVSSTRCCLGASNFRSWGVISGTYILCHTHDYLGFIQDMHLHEEIVVNVRPSWGTWLAKWMVRQQYDGIISQNSGKFVYFRKFPTM